MNSKSRVMKKLNNLLILFSISFFSLSCSAPVMNETKKQKINSKVFIKCKEPRPEICTQEYNPVCATKHSGVMCVTTPCPSTEERNYASGCMACADPKVIKYKQGKCE